jgi:hypothetical protein
MHYSEVRFMKAINGRLAFMCHYFGVSRQKSYKAACICAMRLSFVRFASLVSRENKEKSAMRSKLEPLGCLPQVPPEKGIGSFSGKLERHGRILQISIRALR